MYIHVYVHMHIVAYNVKCVVYALYMQS